MHWLHCMDLGTIDHASHGRLDQLCQFKDENWGRVMRMKTGNTSLLVNLLRAESVILCTL